MAVVAREIRKAKKFKAEPAFKKWLPYSQHVTDHVISTINGEFLTIFKLRGRTHDCASDADLLRWHRDLNYLFKQVSDEHVKYWTHQHHREVHDYPETEWKLAFARHFDNSYRQTFRSKPLMVNDLYLTVVYNPIGDIAQKVFSKFDRVSRQDLVDMQAEALHALDEISSQVLHNFSAYGIQRLGIYYRDGRGEVVREAGEDDESWLEATGLDAEAFEVDPEDLLAPAIEPNSSKEALAADEQIRNARAFSTALEWLSFLCNGEWTPVPVCRSQIREYLMENRPVSSMWGDVLQRRMIDRVDYMAGVEIVDYPDDETEPGQLNLLMEADFEYLLTQSFCPMSLGAAQDFLSKQQLSMLETRDKGRSQIQQLADAEDDVTSRRFVMGFHHATVHVWADSAKEVQKLARKVRGIMTQCGIKAGSVGLAAEAAFYATFPGNHALIPRPVPINSWNFLDFSSFHGFMSGKPNNNPWGPAVTMFKTTAGTPLFFNWHVTTMEEYSFGKRPPGNTLILGRVGAGKTTLLNALLTQSTKFNPRMFCYDKDRGMMPLVAALEGRYTVLKEGERTGWQPIQLEPTKANVAMVKRLLRVCAEITNGAPIDQNYVEQLGAAVDHVMVSGTIPKELRTMTAILRQVPLPARTSADQKLGLAELLRPWCNGGEHGWLFDNPADTLTFDTHDVFGFDLTDFIVAPDQPAPAARTPLLMYLFYRVRQSIDGTRRVIQVFDEFAQYLDDPYMDIEVKRGLKTDRKKDCIYVFSTQEPNDALESRIGKTITQQCVNKILLENPDADPDDYIKGLNLTPAEFQAFLAIPEFSRQFLVKQGSQSAMAMMDLRGMEKAISILSGTPDNADRLENIIAALGDSRPEVWLPKYWDAVLSKRSN
ncbi:conjugal transfer protein TraB [Pseudomonas aeruginosa]|uniref:VirB4 family type IV secretion/conjugal transfer ATPase n=1 Tax=Pseudomonas aeruginosa TaxID=287 RepID=UPI0025A86AE9|nr:conjugal transfer protein TraB [Pseudomonas aeruginosa]HCF1981419.1 conjugal transfer protein TraB [Pseudomonas aeruginosa]HCF6192440.1 conjugal transfer protein TraB [Pseudomonas aeruginosa]